MIAEVFQKEKGKESLLNRERRKLQKEMQRLEKAFSNDKSPKLIMQLSENYKEMDLLEKAKEILRTGAAIHSDNSAIKIALVRSVMSQNPTKEERAELLGILHSILQKTPENLAAQKLWTLHFSSETPDKISTETGIDTKEEHPSIAKDDQLLSQAQNRLLADEVEESLVLFKKILELNPEDEIAKIGFTKAYARLIEKQTAEREEIESTRSAQLKVLHSALNVLQRLLLAVKLKRHN